MTKAKEEKLHLDSDEKPEEYFNTICDLDCARKKSELIDGNDSHIDKNKAARKVFELELKEIELGGILDGKSFKEVNKDLRQAEYDYARHSLAAPAEIKVLYSKLLKAKKLCSEEAPSKRDRLFGPAKAACLAFLREYPGGGMVDRGGDGKRATPSFYHWAERQKNLDGDAEEKNGFSVAESNYGVSVVFEDPRSKPLKECIRKHAGLKVTLSKARKYLSEK